MVKASISQAVKDQVDGDSILQEALARGIVNVSAAARAMESAIRSRIGKEVSEDAVVTSLKRIKGRYERRTVDYLKVLAGSSIEVKTDLSKISVVVSAKTVSTIKSIAFKSYDSFLQISSSPNAYTLVFQQALFESVKKEFDELDLMEANVDLAALIIHSPEDIIFVPGCVSVILSKIAREGVNVEDIVSSYTDTMIVVKMKDVVKAFTALTDLVTEARQDRGVEP